MFKINIDKLFVYFVIIFTLLFLFFSIENYNFLHNQKSIFFNILPNSSVGDSHKYYHDIITNDYSFFEIFKKYLNAFSNNEVHYQGARVYPVNDVQHILYFSFFGNNLILYNIFNYILYIFLIYKIYSFIPKLNKKIFLILNIVNFLIIGSLTSFNKEVICIISFTLFLIYYLNKNVIYLVFSLIFALFSRYEFIIILLFSIICISKHVSFFLKYCEDKFESMIKLKRYNHETKVLFFSLLFYFLSFFLLTLIQLIYEIDFFNLMIGGLYSGELYENLFLKFNNFFIYIYLILLLSLISKFFFPEGYKKEYHLIIILSLLILMISKIIPNYPWYFRQIIDVNAFRTDQTLGITLFLINSSIDGFYFLIFPVKFAFSLFAGAIQRPSLTSYETLFSYISQILFLLLSFYIFYKIIRKKCSTSLPIFFVATCFLIIFSLPPISQHRYVFFLYQFFVIMACFNNNIIKKVDQE